MSEASHEETSALKIPVHGGYFALVDERDGFLEKYKWWQDRHGHVTTTLRGKNKSLHRMIMNTPTGMATDHINGDKLDNRRSNLRICSNRQNLFNRGPQANNKSGLKGVSWNRPLSKWVAQIAIDKKQTYLGLFERKEDAAIAYDKAAKEHHGEFARLNYGA